jgi:membrane associated rhomboid family serine protease
MKALALNLDPMPARAVTLWAAAGRGAVMSSAVNWSEFRRFSTLTFIGAIAAAVTIAWGAKLDISPLLENAEIRRGEVWRLVTSAFPHVNALHLIFNLYWLWEFGRPVEQVFGHAKTALLLALFASGSAAFEFALMSGGIGLSGVVYGLLGMLWVLWRRDDRFRNALNRSTILLFVGWFAFCVVATVKNIFPVGNVAHGVGFVFGVLIGLALTSPRQRWLVNTAIAALLLFGLWGATLGRPTINLSGAGGDDEAQWGYDALMSDHGQEAVRWLRDASRLRPNVPEYWFNLGIAYERTGNALSAKAAYDHAHQLEAKQPAAVQTPQEAN